MRSELKTFAKAAIAGVARHRWPSLQRRLWILMYHRVLPPDDPRAVLEEPGMQITPQTFENHLRWLRSEFDIVKLQDWLDAPQAMTRRACAITFDDGWLDNYQFAFPILQRYAVPATIFVVTRMIGTSRIFWPNRLIRLIRAGASLRHPSLPQLNRIPSPPDITLASATEIIRHCKGLPENAVLKDIEKAESIAGIDNLAMPRELLNWEELSQMMKSGIIDVGSHTQHHTRLSNAVNSAALRRAVIDSKQDLEGRLDVPVKLFCYPNGDVSASAIKLVNDHYQAALTTRRGVNTTATPKHQLFRIGMHEDAAKSRINFFARLSGWF